MWRELLYPLGYIAQIAFGWRFLQQWIQSERVGKSVVTRSFWLFSLIGNTLLFIHSFIQLQFHICVIQICNAVISWRNLNLMQPVDKQIKFSSVIGMMIGLTLFTGLLFMIQGFTSVDGVIEWFRMPTWNGKAQSVNNFWHLLGTVGMILFSSRFWIQWWCAEQQHESYLGPSFWWLSIAGACLTLIYAVSIWDPVNVIGPAFGLIPYVRNIMLSNRPLISKKPPLL